jgi:hypothetical protein
MANPSPVTRKGRPNKATKELKEMILGALDDAGGQAYLAARALDTPGPFLALLGKILPKDVNNNVQIVDKAELLKNLAESLPK